MVTIKDIAAATGVSATTVSNVINGKAGRVSAQTIESINKAIKDLQDAVGPMASFMNKFR